MKVFCILMISAAFALSPLLGLKLSLLGTLPFVALLLVNPTLHREYITIDENGISCLGARDQLWAFKWEDIADLKKSTYLRFAVIEIIAYDELSVQKQIPFRGYYFQLGRAAHKALKKYYVPRHQ